MHKHNNRFSWLFLVLVPLIMSVLTPTALAAGDGATSPPGGKYTVRANDTLWEIANRYGITVAQLTAANPDVSPEALHSGQTLTIPSKTPPVTGADSNAGAASGTGAVYTVKPNDTLWDIATKYGVFVNDLLAANPGVDPQRLMAGQILIIPGEGARAIPASASTPATARYTVRADDTLWDIAANYGLSLNDLLAANPGVDPRRLMAGQELMIPGITQDALAAMQAPPPPPAPSPDQAPVPITEQAPAEQPPAEQAPAPAPEQAPPPAEQPPAPAPAEINPMALAMLEQINAKRVAGGRPALTWNPLLAAAAQAHANDCSNRNRGSHTGSDGSRLVNRLQRVGYPYKWHGENWANARSVERAMEMWWNEPPGADPHVQNIMASRATEIGIGVAKGAWGYYFIADFGSQ